MFGLRADDPAEHAICARRPQSGAYGLASYGSRYALATVARGRVEGRRAPGISAGARGGRLWGARDHMRSGDSALLHLTLPRLHLEATLFTSTRCLDRQRSNLPSHIGGARARRLVAHRHMLDAATSLARRLAGALRHK